MQKISMLAAFLFFILNVYANDTASIRVMTYNVHHCNPPAKAGVIDVDAIAKTILSVNPDIVALQEIDVHTGRSGKTIDEAQALAHLTGMHAFFLKNIDYDGGAYGVAILSKARWLDTATLKLPMKVGSKGEPRGLAMVSLKLKNGRQVNFACTHLDLKPENRILQMNAIRAFVKKYEVPVILAGDLNSMAGSKVINTLDRFMQRTCDDCPFTIPEINPDRAIDFIAFTPGKFAVTKHEVIQGVYASDHLPVFADLRFANN